MNKLFFLLIILFSLTACGTIVNDPNVPVSLAFSDGSEGTCKLSNKRAQYLVDVPSTTMVRRSDDALEFDCKTSSGKFGYGSIPSEMEGGKVAASVVFFDLGITDAITDKSRIYPSSFVIPVKDTGKGLFE